jgi:hypothetical protein
MAAQILERQGIVAIEQGRLSLHPDSRGAKDLSDQTAAKLVHAHRCARDTGVKPVVLKFDLPILAGWLNFRIARAVSMQRQFGKGAPARGAFSFSSSIVTHAPPPL